MDLDNVDFLSIGVHCAVCKVLQYLPNTCHHCGTRTCDEHAATHVCAATQLKDRSLPRCPDCQQFVALPAGQTADNMLALHLASGCRLHLAKGHSDAHSSHKPHTKRCAHCRTKLGAVSMACNGCRQTFCLAHRFPDSHACQPSACRTAAAAARSRQRASPRSPTAAVH